MSTRRNARLRKEYLYRKGLEGKEKLVYEKKRKLRDALDAGKTIPTELKGESTSLQKDMEFDDAVSKERKTHIDDEYARAGIVDPKIMITTSRDPSRRLAQFVKELRLVFPNSQRINRGNTVVKELVQAAQANDVTDIVVVHEHRGEPDGLIISHMPYGPTAFFNLTNCVLRHDIRDKKLGAMSEAYPHLIFSNFSTGLGLRLQNVLKYLFPVPKADSTRVMTFANRDDTISFRHNVFTKQGHKQIDLAEVGPRFEMKLYQVRFSFSLFLFLPVPFFPFPPFLLPSLFVSFVFVAALVWS